MRSAVTLFHIRRDRERRRREHIARRIAQNPVRDRPAPLVHLDALDDRRREVVFERHEVGLDHLDRERDRRAVIDRLHRALHDLREHIAIAQPRAREQSLTRRPIVLKRDLGVPAPIAPEVENLAANSS
jgi:hypothetical protein